MPSHHMMIALHLVMEVCLPQHRIWHSGVEKRLVDSLDVPEKLAVDPKIDTVEAMMTIFLIKMTWVQMDPKIHQSSNLRAEKKASKKN